MTTIAITDVTGHLGGYVDKKSQKRELLRVTWHVVQSMRFVLLM